MPNLYDKFSSFEVEPGVRCSFLCGKEAKLISKPPVENALTTWQCFLHGVEVSHADRCLGWRQGDGYTWLIYDKLYELVKTTARALGNETNLKRQSFVGIYSASCPQWIQISLACGSRSLVVVPIYDTLGTSARRYAINEVEMSIIFVDTEKNVNKLLEEAESMPTLKKIIVFTGVSDHVMEQARKQNVELITLKDFYTKNNTDIEPFDPPAPEDLAVILYTSGTTGDPKGVMHTHRSMVASFSAFDCMFGGEVCPELVFRKSEVVLLYLPLAHSYGQLIVTWFLYHGAGIGFHSGDITKLMEDVALLKPTYMPLVPRLMNRLYQKVTATVAESKLRSKIFWYCYKKKRSLLRKGIITKNTIWDKIAFRKLQNLLGGRIWLMSVGSAPVAPEVLEFWRVCFGACVLEGYGQTECAAAATFAFDACGGNVGHPSPCDLIKLADVPELGYLSSDGVGEICIKGDNLMSGYFKQPEKTAEAIDTDGWLHTGDIGKFLPKTGALKIIDRKKHIFKLAQGEYIAPEKIESVYAMCPQISQVYVDGDSLEVFL